MAIEWLQRAITVGGAAGVAGGTGDVRLLELLADAQVKAGDRSAAAATIAQGLEKEPKNAALLGLARRLRRGSN
jgi:hypothetical protein